MSKKDNNTYKNNKKNQYSIICSNNNFNLDKKYIKIDYFFEEFEKKLYIEDIDYDKFHCEFYLQLRKKNIMDILFDYRFKKYKLNDN